MKSNSLKKEIREAIRMNISGVDKQSIEEATAEAEAKPLEFDPKERATFLRSMLAAVPPLVAHGVPATDITARYPKLAEEYPKLLKMMLAKEDLSPINAMLKALDRMATGSLTQHKASILVGQTLVDTFVKPQLNGHAGDTRGR